MISNINITINMNVSVSTPSRILFGTNGVYETVIEDDTVTCDTVVCSDNAVLDGNDLVPYIESQRVHPVLDNVIASNNIRDGAVSLTNLVQSPPLSTDRGGTGLSNVPFGHLLVGTPEGTLRTSSNVSWNGYNLEVRGDLHIGDVRVGWGNDVYGRPSLFSFDAQGHRTNMVAPGLSAPECGISDVSVGASEVTVTLAKMGGFPVDAFFAWSDTVATFNKASVTTPGRPGVMNSGRVSFRGESTQYTIASGVSSATYSLAAVMRDARGTVSPVSYSTFTFP